MGAQTTYPSQPAIGYAGQLDTSAPHTELTAKNTEGSASISPGKQAVCFRRAGATSDMDVLLPAAQTDIVMGIPQKVDTHDRTWTDSDGNTHGDLGPNGYIPGTLFVASRKGRMLCVAATAVKPGDKLYVRAAGGLVGALENAADAANMIDCTKQAEWVSTAAPGALAWLEYDFTA